jgi:predicted amidophosphoribosyltransferase
MTPALAGLLDLLLPKRCAGCGEAGAECCPDCLAEFGDPRPVAWTGPPVHALAAYRGVARELVLAYKERGRRELAAPLGILLGLAVPLLAAPTDGTWWLVPAPSRRAAARRRGGEHVLRLARHAAEVLGPAAVAPALGLAAGTHDSVGLDAAARRSNLAGRVVVREAALPPSGTEVVLLDDVVTTGATAAACTAALTAAGLRVSAVLALTTAASLTKVVNRVGAKDVCSRLE